jgi:hypothetical protein
VAIDAALADDETFAVVSASAAPAALLALTEVEARGAGTNAAREDFFGTLADFAARRETFVPLTRPVASRPATAAGAEMSEARQGDVASARPGTQDPLRDQILRDFARL